MVQFWKYSSISLIAGISNNYLITQLWNKSSSSSVWVSICKWLAKWIWFLSVQLQATSVIAMRTYV